MSSVSIFNGETVVVVLFISRVLIAAVPHSLTYEAFTLFLLAFAALFVEIFLENSTSFTRFKTRPGASSGILLGAVTLPSVMLSRSIQLSRAIQSKDIEPQELDYLILQYWAVSATCFGVLVFLCFILQCSTDAISYFRLHSFKDTNFSLFYTAFFAAVFSLSLAMRCEGGSHIAIKLFWVFCHGLAAVRLIEHILHTFPSCVSLGEALLVTSGLVLYFGDMLLQTLAKVNTYLVSSEIAPVQFGIKRSEISTIIQGVMIGLLIFPLCYKFILRMYHSMPILFNIQSPEAEEKTSEVIEKSLVFYAALMVTIVVIAPAWMQFIVHFDSHPLLWVFEFVFEDPLKRLALCIYWITVICASVLRFYNISKSSTIERILLRKYYHLVAVLMFSPALVFQPSFTDLAFGAALAVFLVLEIIRVWNIWPLGKHVHQFMNAFTDHRDSDLLIVSHFSLLLGCALPKWMSYGFNDRPLAPFAGILSLGIGDTMASMVGHKYGVLRWSKTGKKTIEGTAAGITSVLAACSVLLPLIASSAYIHSQHWVSLLVAVTGSGLLEAYTAQLDNAFIPLVFYSLLCL